MSRVPEQTKTNLKLTGLPIKFYTQKVTEVTFYPDKKKKERKNNFLIVT